MDNNDVIKALNKVMDPELNKSLVALNMVQNIKIDNDNITLDIELTTPACPLKDTIKKSVVEALTAIGAKQVNVNMTSRVVASKKTGVGNFIDSSAFEGIKNIIPVYSTKGGVGKSTIAVNLAVALAKSGAKVALLDIDVYGPSIPRMLGITAKNKPQMFGNKIVPVEKHGIFAMSLGMLMSDSGQPVIWRGPITNSAVKQLFEDVAWEDIDYMIVDMPPGTGDIQITFAQNVPAAGAIFITSPQNISIDDTIKGIRMFQKMNVPILGIINNMVYFVCPKCGEKTAIFPKGNFEKRMHELNIKILGELPLEPTIASCADNGIPVVIEHSDSDTAKTFISISETVAASLSVLNH